MAWWMMIPAVMQASGTLMQGQAQDRASKIEAAQLRAQAAGERASASRTAAEAMRQTQLVQSRAQALAAASGGGATDPNVVNAMADLSAAGEYEAMSALYEGETAARGMNFEAKYRRAQGKMAKRMSVLNALAGVGAGAYDAGMFSKYGDGGFKGVTSGNVYSAQDAARKGIGTMGRIAETYG